jgi:hypothetical protein
MKLKKAAITLDINTERKRRSFRCSDEEWEAIQRKAKEEGISVSDLIWWAVMKFMKDHPAPTGSLMVK